MIQPLILKDKKTREAIIKLQRSSYAIEAKLIQFDQIPPLLESESELEQCEETFFGFFIEDSLAGLISFRIDGEVLDIHRLAVDPKFFKQGIGKALVDWVVSNHAFVTKVIVSTGRDNLPAIQLYERLGFVKTDEELILDSLWLVHFEKSRAATQQRGTCLNV